MRTLKEALELGFFQGGTLDLFFRGKHLRIRNLYLITKGQEIYPDPSKPQLELLQFRGGSWKRARSQVIDMYLDAHAIPVAYHDQDRKLMFVTLKHSTREGVTAQFVLYKAGREPQPGDLHIIDWPIGLNPILSKGEANENNIE